MTGNRKTPSGRERTFAPDCLIVKAADAASELSRPSETLHREVDGVIARIGVPQKTSLSEARGRTP